MKYGILFLSITFCLGQDTKISTSADLSTKPNSETIVGSLKPGTSVRKLKLDHSGKYVKVSIEVFVPVSSLEDPTVSLPVGSTQIADGVKFKVVSAKQSGKQVKVKVQITNTNSKAFDFMALTLMKVSASGDNSGELNPFEGNNTVSFGIKKGKKITSELVFDFKKPPNNVELICRSTMKNSEKVYFQLGF
jgi:hypothetical protein